MAFKKYARKKLGQAARAASTYGKRRYFKRTTGALKTGKLARDVMMLKRMVNVEKKFHQLFPTSSTIGQCVGNASGTACLDITPVPPQGLASNNITGNSFKLTGAYIELQMTQQSALHVPSHYIFEMWNVVGTPESTGTALTQLFNISTFSGVIDAYSVRNQDHFADYRLIKKWKVAFPQDALSGNVIVKTQQFALKLDKHIRLNGSATVQNGQMIMTVRGNYGNASTTTASTLVNVGTTAINTGATLIFTTKYWFVDN